MPVYRRMCQRVEAPDCRALEESGVIPMFEKQMTLEERLSQSAYETKFEYEKWMEAIPDITFPGDWKVKIIPPFGGALIRFRVKKGERKVSVYFDAYDQLGVMGVPYWEIYPNAYGDTERYLMDDVEGLVEGINDALEGSWRKVDQ